MRITRRLEIDAGHRLLRHEGKCRHLHGHRYAFEITVDAPVLDSVGRVVDFGVVKERVGGWLDEQWDHAMILQEGDPAIAFVREQGMRHFVLPHPPTAEVLCAFVHGIAAALLPSPLTVARVRCYETPNSWADTEGHP